MPARRPPAPAEDRRTGVVVLEDDDALREHILLPGLQDFGFDVVGAASAGGLYRAMLERGFDLAVLDIGLPDESGLSVVAHLRKVSPRMGVVMLTANRERDDQVRALSHGADAFLRKPVDIEVLALTYVKRDGEPTERDYDARSVRAGTAHTVRFAAPQAGTYYIKLVGGARGYSGVTLIGRQ